MQKSIILIPLDCKQTFYLTSFPSSFEHVDAKLQLSLSSSFGAALKKTLAIKSETSCYKVNLILETQKLGWM